MRIILIPSIKTPYQSQIEYSIDRKLYKLINDLFLNPEILLPEGDKKSKKIDLIIISGGNNLSSKENIKANIERDKLSKKYLNLALKDKIPIIGICYGAQFIAEKYNSTLVKVKNHVGKHKIYFDKKIKLKNFKYKLIVNSFHQYAIKHISKDLDVLATASDFTIELFHHKKNKILGMMWHPERYKNIRSIDAEIIKTFYRNKL
tara:strand:+ start:444 stop:1055 length:612 start_codon:yes stop_codon:yes gene_type:complete